MTEDVKRIFESFDSYREKKLTPQELIKHLYYECGLKMNEVLTLCEQELYGLYDEDTFREIAVDIKISELPSGGYIGEDGITVIYGSEETC